MDAIFYINVLGEIARYLVLFVTVINFCIFFSPFLTNKVTKYITNSVFAVFTVVTYAYWEDFNAKITYGTIMILTCVIMYALERQNLKQKVYLCICFYVMRYLMAGIMAELSFYTRDLPIVTKILQQSVLVDVIYFTIDQMLYVALSFLVLYLGIRLFHKAYCNKHEDLTRNELLFLCIPQLVIMFVSNIVAKYFNLFNEGISNGSIKANIPADGYRFLFYLTAYVMQLIMILTYQKMKDDERKRHQTDIIATQIQEMKNHLEHVELLYKEAQSLRHDMGNHIQVMEHLVETNNNREAIHYLSRMKAEQINITPVIKTGNPVTDIILQEKMREAECRNISCSFDYHFPTKNQIDAFDMSIILSNLLDNCIESASGDNPEIKVLSKQVEDVYILNIENTFCGQLVMNQDTGVPISSKGAEHGIGLQNVNQVVRKYSGNLVFEQEKDKIIVSVVIPSHP